LIFLFFFLCSRENLYEILDGSPGKVLLEKCKDYGIIGVTFWESGFKQFTANKLIQKPQDFKGLNVRVMKSMIIMDQFKAFGANPIPIDFHKTYQALADGVVNGQENPISTIACMKFYEVQSHLIISNHAYLAHAFVFSKSILHALPLKMQKLLISTARDITFFQLKEAIEKEKKLISTIKKAGCQIYRLTKDEIALFKQATKKVIDKFEQTGDSNLLSMIQNHIKKKNQALKNEIIIGLNADLAAGSALAGISIKRGMEIAVDEINQRGGLLGKKLRIIVRNNSGITRYRRY